MVSTETDTSGPDLRSRGRTSRADEQLPSGTIVDNRYCIEGLLGEGGMGAVYAAEHVKVGRRVALKVLAAHWCESDDVVRRFRDEARAASAAGHPNIVEVFDAGDLPDGRPYLVMEHLEGRELADVIDRHGPLEPRRACRIIRDVARALDAAHARGVIHRDLKGENVMLVERGGEETVKVLDFGIAANNALGGPRTLPGLVMGTPATMAPEQVKGKAPTIAFDVYALGVLLHFVFSGRMPFDDREGLAVLVAKTSEPAPSLRTLCDDLPATLIELVDSCLAIDPAMRPATAREVADRLSDALEELTARRVAAGPTVSVPEPPAATAAVAPRRAAPAPGWRRGIVPAVVLVAVGSLAAGSLVLREAPREAAGGEAIPTELPSAEVPVRPEPRAEPAPPPPAANDERPPEPGSTAAPTPREPSPGERTVASAGSPEAGRVEPVAEAPRSEAEPTPDSALCQRIRKQAQQARIGQDWSGMLRHTRSASCWSGHLEERRRLRAKAFMELEDWSACMEASRGFTDAEGRRWYATCRGRKGNE